MPAYHNKTSPNRGKRFQGKGWRDPYRESLYFQLSEGLEFAFYLRKQSLERLNKSAFNVFDGGETVYVKIVDEEGTEYVQSYPLKRQSQF
jgi:hypothetical protein